MKIKKEKENKGIERERKTIIIRKEKKTKERKFEKVKNESRNVKNKKNTKFDVFCANPKKKNNWNKSKVEIEIDQKSKHLPFFVP